MTKNSPQEPRVSPLVFVILTILIEVIGSGLVAPLIPYIVDEFSSDALTVSLLASSYAGAQFLAAPVLGTLSDRVGRRPVLLVCTFNTALAFFIFGLAQALWIMFLAQIINGLTAGVVTTAQGYLADISNSKEERTKSFGLIGAAAGIGFILGPALGATLAGVNLRLPVLVAGSLALANFVMGYFTLKESLKEPIKTPLTVRSFSTFAQLRDLMERSHLRYLFSGYFLFYLGFAGLTSIFVVFVRDEFSWGPAEAAGVLVWVGVITTLVQGGLIGKLVLRFSNDRLVIVGLTGIVIALIGICFIPRGIYLYGTQTLFAFSVGLASPTLRGTIANGVPDSEQGKVSGGSQSIVSLAQIIGPIVAGGAYDYLNSNFSFGLQAFLVGLALVCFLKSLSSRPSSSTPIVK